MRISSVPLTRLTQYPTELISKTGNVLLTSNGFKSFNFSGIKDRLLLGKRQAVHTQIEPPKPIHRQIGHLKDAHPSQSGSSSVISDSSVTLAMPDIPPGRKSASSNYTLKSSRRTGSTDASDSSRRSSDHGEDVEEHTPRRKLMSLLHRNGSPRQSPSRVSLRSTLDRDTFADSHFRNYRHSLRPRVHRAKYAIVFCCSFIAHLSSSSLVLDISLVSPHCRTRLYCHVIHIYTILI